jgi:hypothetical protein
MLVAIAASRLTYTTFLIEAEGAERTTPHHFGSMLLLYCSAITEVVIHMYMKLNSMPQITTLITGALIIK